MKKSFYFYTSIALSIILGLVIGNYIFGWTTPLANPPSSNLSAPINTGASNQSKSGYLAVGTSTTPTYPLEVGNQLRVWGQLISKVASGTTPFVVDSTTKVDNLNADYLDGYHAADLLASSMPTFYFTDGKFKGDSAATACAANFHMCTGAEWYGRKAHPTLDCNTDCWDEGAWVDLRGNQGGGSLGEDCLNWTTSSSAAYGLVIKSYATTDPSGWLGSRVTCNNEVHVLCCSD